jgi:REP-associated tyrosine transposase
MVRGNDRRDVFATDGDRLAFLNFVREASVKHEVDIHAYVLMSNHVHLLVTGRRPASLSRTIQAIGRRYVPLVNRRWPRTGTLWEGRFLSTLVDNHLYAFNVLRYIEMNPVRAGMVAHPAAHIWSSYLHHAFGRPDDLLTPHVCYTSLGATPEERQRRYGEIAARPIAEELLAEIRHASRHGWALGSDEFRRRIEAATGRRAAPRSDRGRPRRDPKKAK